MTTSKTTAWRRAAGMTLALAIGLAPGAAHARGGTLKGTFGTEKFKARRILVACGYQRSINFFSIGGSQVSHKHSRAAFVSGTGADPTAPGAAFPIVLTMTEASYVSGPIGDPAPATWTAALDAVGVTITRFKKGKISGTFAGTLAPSGATTTPVQVQGTFNAKCLIQ